MRNGLTKTLAAAAIACLGYQAHALAPVILNIPSPVVVNDANPAGATAPNTFVYADFVNLQNFVNDDGDPASIVWSYTSSQATIPGRYKLNMAAKMNIPVAGDNPISPPSNKQLNNAGNITSTGEFNPDNNPLTPTIRDIIQSPDPHLGVPNVPSGSPAGTIFASEVITLFASDGSTFGQNNLIIYSQEVNAGVVDRLSQVGGPTPTPNNVSTQSFLTVTNGWQTGASVGPIVYSSNTAGICIHIDALGPLGTSGGTLAQWFSPYGTGGIPNVQNAVWRIRSTMTCDQTTAGLVPLWDIQVQNLSSGTAGANSFIGDYLFLDNVGSADAIAGPAAGINQFDIWYTPSPQETTQWNNPALGTTGGAFNATHDPNNDMRLIFRVLAAGNAGYQGELDNGTLCLTNLVIDRFDLAASKYSSVVNVYNLNPIVSGINGVSVINLIGDSNPGTSGAGSIVDFTTAPLTLSPLDPAGWLLELTVITPGDNNNPTIGTSQYGNGSAVVDNFPIPWVSNTLYRTQVVMTAPTLADETHPADAILIGYESKTDEIFGDSFVTTGLDAAGMPKSASINNTYDAFFWSHAATKIQGVSEAARLRWKIQVLSTPAFNQPTPDVNRNTGALRIQSIKVDKVTFYGM